MDFFISRRIFLPFVEQTDKSIAKVTRKPESFQKVQEARSFHLFFSLQNSVRRIAMPGRRDEEGKTSSERERERTENCGNVVRRG